MRYRYWLRTVKQSGLDCVGHKSHSFSQDAMHLYGVKKAKICGTSNTANPVYRLGCTHTLYVSSIFISGPQSQLIGCLMEWKSQRNYAVPCNHDSR